MNQTKRSRVLLSAVLCLVMMLTILPMSVFAEEQEAPIINPEDWEDGDGYGNAAPQEDPNLVILTGDDEINSDNSHCGPFTKANPSHIEGGTIVDKVNLYIDPDALVVGDKFSVTTAMNDLDGNYITETLVGFWKNHEGGISVSMGLDPSFSANITEAGLYTLKYSFIPGDPTLSTCFAILKDGVTFASSAVVPCPVLLTAEIVDTAEVSTRRYIWFCDISVADGLMVYSVYDADYSKVDDAIAAIPADLSLYTDATAAAVNNAKTAVVTGKNATEQSTVNGYATAINDAVAALVYKDADYSEVDAAIAEANTLTKDLYKDFSAVDAAIAAVVRGKNISAQSDVDAMADAIKDAIEALVYKDADYSKVDAAINKAKALTKASYKDFSKVDAAIAAVVRGKNITAQSDVDAMAKAIEDAISALVLKSKDTTDDPKTADENSLLIYISLMLLAGGGVAVTTLNRKKKTQK